MKFPNHLILDLQPQANKHTSQYWAEKYLHTFKTKTFFFNTITDHRLFAATPQLPPVFLLSNRLSKFTLNHSHENDLSTLNPELKLFYKTRFKLRLKVKNRSTWPLNVGKSNYYFLTHTKEKYNKPFLNYLMKQSTPLTSSSLIVEYFPWQLFNVNFLKKEKMYTKLKYSRVPQYDAVSGGFAALFSGFLGFLVCEKFGFEFLDSGDFYYLFMYGVFLFFFLRLFIKLIENENSSWNPLSPKWFFFFLSTLFNLIIKYCNQLLRKLKSF